MPTVLMSGTEWAASVGEAPIRADVALPRLDEVIAYAHNGIDEVMARLGGTVPTAKQLMPTLYGYLDTVEKMRDAVAVALKANPDAELQAPAVQAGKAAGFKVIEETNRLVGTLTAGPTISVGNVVTFDNVIISGSINANLATLTAAAPLRRVFPPAP